MPAASNGERSVGAAGASGRVVNEKGAENGPWPPVFFPLTRQKYVVAAASPLAEYAGDVNPAASMSVVANDPSVEIWMWYVLALATAPQPSDRLSGSFVAPFTGDES